MPETTYSALKEFMTESSIADMKREDKVKLARKILAEAGEDPDASILDKGEAEVGVSTVRTDLLKMYKELYNALYSARKNISPVWDKYDKYVTGSAGKFIRPIVKLNTTSTSDLISDTLAYMLDSIEAISKDMKVLDGM